MNQPDNQVGRLCSSRHLYLVEVRVLVIFGTLFSFELISLDLRTEKFDLLLPLECEAEAVVLLHYVLLIHVSASSNNYQLSQNV